MTNEVQYFQLLKTKLQATLQASYPHFSREIHTWKGQEIIALQEALHQKVKGYISEKWFYTHLKPTQNEKLPRIDMLDMLAQYVGYAGWQDFMFQEAKDTHHASKINPFQNKLTETRNSKRYFLFIIAILGISSSFWSLNFLAKGYTFEVQFCFQDADTEKVIQKDIDIWVLNKRESPKLHKTKNGCTKIKTTDPTLTFVVKAPYYKTDTITRALAKGQASEVIKLKKDDYALLIQLIAKHGTNEAEKEQRIKKLEKMFDEEVQVFQIDEAGLGIELYSKAEFIDKLSLPISSLRNIQIIDIQYQKDKIMLLRFIQN